MHLRDRLRNAAFGVLPPLLAFLVQYSIWSLLRPLAFFLFYPAVFFSSWLGGLGGGLVATLLSEILVLYFFLPPEGSFAIDGPRVTLQMAVFGSMGVLFSVFHERLRTVSSELEERIRTRTGELAEANELSEQQETHLAAIVEASIQAVISIDGQRRIRLLNPAALEMFGCRAEEVLGTSVDRFIPEIFRERFQQVLAEFPRSSGRARSLGTGATLRACRADGTVFPVEASVSSVAVGEETIFTLMVADVSERVRAEHEVRETLARYREMLESMMEGAEIIGYDKRFLYVNAAMCRYVRRTAESMLGRRVAEVFPGVESTGFYATVDRCLVDRVPGEFEGEFVFPDGSTGYFQVLARPVPEGVLVLTMELTEHRRAAERLLEQASWLDKAQDAIQVRDLGHYITYWNKGAERMYGWTAAEAVGRRVSELLYRDMKEFHAATSHVFENGEWSGELLQVTKAGLPIRVDARWTLVRGADGRPQSILAINTDVTEKKALEQQYLRAQRMESLGSLAGGIAHDLNNVLAPILLSVDVLGSVSNDPKVKSTLAILENSAKHGADLVRQILSFARGEDGDRTLVDLKHVARDVVQMLRETMPPGIALEADLPSGLPLVRADATQLGQVLMNLGVNARDAMGESGRLAIFAEVLDLDEAARYVGAKPGRHVVLAVSDTGSGISAADQQRIFDPFYTTKAPGKGTGLGLATVATIVKNHGGFLTLESEPGKGTTFRIAFPAEPETAVPSAAGTADDLPRGHGEAVLVIDDEESVRRMTVETLEVFGYRAIAASHGEEGILLFDDHRDEVRVVVCDMRMPGLDGRATIAGLRRIDPSVCVIAISGMTDGVGEAEGGGVPDVFEFLAKPYSVRRLLTVLRRAFQSAGTAAVAEAAREASAAAPADRR